MKPLNCCNGCEWIDKDGKFRNKLHYMFCEPHAIEYTKILYNEQRKEKGCSTCKHCVRVWDFTPYVTAEECEFAVGLECDTVLFNVKNCPKLVGKHEEWNEE